ncbi:MAG: nucleotidyl transferase AbiEii/AbiGii toxin family protein [Bdellovibrio sp.]|nr:nucleotidyl transferase AbiEii/AbiGii toxin family protein [Bdellovibrio sp.]
MEKTGICQFCFGCDPTRCSWTDFICCYQFPNKCLPAISQEKVFALQGGTAINMFVRPMPRLSVDIDLTYLPIEDRDTTLKKIGNALENIAKKVEKTITGVKVQKTARMERIAKLVVSSSEAIIKIEPNEVLRGVTAEPRLMDLVKEAEVLFEFSVSAPVIPLTDLYGGKICAALDRQHPRDLFDILILLENEGITDKIRKGFLVFLASHNRPMHELIKPTLKDISKIYENDFKEMISKPVSIEKLYNTRETLIKTLGETMTTDEKRFLLSLKEGNPEWNLPGIPNIDKFPGIQWKLMNIKKMSLSNKN